jgi:N-acetylneuraminic acid mutarotase
MLIITIIVMPAFILPSTRAAAEESSPWTTLESMPTSRSDFGLGVVNGKIYAIGGLNGSLHLNTNEEFNPLTGHWASKTTMPTARSSFAVAVFGGKIYVIGGTIGNGGYIGNNEVYDPASDTWETKASMPTPRADLSACVVNDKIYLIGGIKYSSQNPNYKETSINEVYDPTTDTWATAAPIPMEVQGSGAAAVNNQIYIIGGSRNGAPQNSTIVNSTQVYDPQSNKWTQAANLPILATNGASAATTGTMAPTRIYYIGGFTSTVYSNDTQVYNPLENAWSIGLSMPTSRADFGIAVVSDTLYAIGGYDGVNWLNTTEQYKPVGYGMIPPTVDITSPENKTYTSVTLSFTVNKGTDWMGFSLDNQANVTINEETKLSNLTQGSHSITIFANDSAGNMGVSNTVFFSVDTLPPNIDIMLPLNQTYDSSDISLTFVVSEATSSISYSLDGQQNVTVIGNVTIPALMDGPHSLTVFATDELGNSGSATAYFKVATFPTITVVAAIATIIIISASGYIVVKRKNLSING